MNFTIDRQENLGHQKCVCGKKAFVLVSGMMLCGDCIVNLEKDKQKMIFERLQVKF